MVKVSIVTGGSAVGEVALSALPPGAYGVSAGQIDIFRPDGRVVIGQARRTGITPPGCADHPVYRFEQAAYWQTQPECALPIGGPGVGADFRISGTKDGREVTVEIYFEPFDGVMPIQDKTLLPPGENR